MVSFLDQASITRKKRNAVQETLYTVMEDGMVVTVCLQVSNANSSAPGAVLEVSLNFLNETASM